MTIYFRLHTVHVTLTQHSYMGVFQVGPSLLWRFGITLLRIKFGKNIYASQFFQFFFTSVEEFPILVARDFNWTYSGEKIRTSAYQREYRNKTVKIH